MFKKLFLLNTHFSEGEIKLATPLVPKYVPDLFSVVPAKENLKLSISTGISISQYINLSVVPIFLISKGSNSGFSNKSHTWLIFGSVCILIFAELSELIEKYFLSLKSNRKS